MTRTEELVYALCNRTFLSLWSFPNPLAKKGKELCDVLVVCEPDIVIFSIKEINIKESGDLDLDIERWMQRAITESVKQIYGAEKYIESVDKIFLKDRKTEIYIPKSVNWKIHRIAVGFGRGDKFPMQYGEFGKGFVHAFDEKSVQIVLHELDTIKDFIHYLNAKEEFIRSKRTPFNYGEEDMLAYYLSNNFAFPDKGDFVIFQDDLYEGLSNDPEYKKIMAGLKVSYAWDNLIEKLIEDFRKGDLINEVSREELELTIRQMAREDRNARKVLSEQFLDFIGVNKPSKIKARLVKSNDNPDLVYLFVSGAYEDRDIRMKELLLRSFVVRGIYDCKTIVGLATEKYNPKGYSLDFSYSCYPDFSEDFRLKAKEISEELGYFNKPEQREL